jgi:hypothetical protein
MAEATRRIHVDKSSELARQLDEAQRAGEPVVLEVDGHAFRLVPHDADNDDPWKDYDPDKVREALRRSAGALRGVDHDKLLADLREQRGQDSHGRPA